MAVATTGTGAGSSGNSCTGLPTNAVYYGSATTYSITGGGTTATYTTGALTANTCNYNCASGYGWNGASCVQGPVVCYGTGVVQTSHQCVFSFLGAAQYISIIGNTTLTVNGWGGGGAND